MRLLAKLSLAGMNNSGHLQCYIRKLCISHWDEADVNVLVHLFLLMEMNVRMTGNKRAVIHCFAINALPS